MIKLFFTMIVIGLLFVVGWVIFALLKASLNLKPEPESMTSEDLDTVIEELEFRVMRAERSAENGITKAEKELEYLKTQLEKAREIKSKLK